MLHRLKLITAFSLFFPLFPAFGAPITDFADPLLNGASVVDFDNYTSDGYLNDFETDIVNFHNDRQFGSNYFATDAYQTGMSGRIISLYGEARFTFDSAVNAVAFTLSAFNSDWTLQTLDQAGGLIEQITLPNPVGSAPVVRGVGGYDFWGVQLFDSGATTDIVTMDNLHFNSSVPEPPTVFLLSLFLGFLGMFQRGKTADPSSD